MSWTFRLTPFSRTITVVLATGLVLVYFAYSITDHHLLSHEHRSPLFADFLAVWSAGTFAREGTALSAYNPSLMHAAEAAILGHNFSGRFDWPYPPFYFFIIAPLSYLKYGHAFVAWALATMAGYAAVIGAVARNPRASLYALAAPWMAINMNIGQNGMLTAMLFGLILLCLEPRPVLAGIFLGLLAYKPQFGILFPIALAAGGYWRVMAWASITIVCLFVASTLAFGAGALSGFLHALATTSQSLLIDGFIGWSQFQSIYGVMRALGAPAAGAWFAQAIVTIGSAIVIGILWNNKGRYNLKAAGMCTVALFATPYVLVYDLAILAVAVGFLQRERAIDRSEMALLGIAAVEVVIRVHFFIPTGFFAAAAVALMVVRRLYPSTAALVPLADTSR